MNTLWLVWAPLLALATALGTALCLVRRHQRAARDENTRLAASLHHIIDGTRAGTWEWHIQSGEVRYNERWAEIAGWRLDELQPLSIGTWMALAHPDDLRRSNEALERHFRGETDHYDCELRMRHRDGHWVWIHDRGRVSQRDANGQPVWMFGTHVDISARRAAEAERGALLERLQELAANVPGVLFQFRLRPDGSSHLPYASAGLRDVFGCEAPDVAEDARPVFAAIHPDDLATIKASIETSANTLLPWHETFRVCHPERGERWLEGNATPTRQADSSVTWHGHIRDITELHHSRERLKLAASVLKARQQELDHIAHYDPLTGVPNRRLLGDRLQQALAHGRRSGQRVAVCLMDLDGFKPVNDTRGHDAGDRLLVAIAQRLGRVLRAGETVARLGGDEFVLIFRDIASETVFERVLQTVREPVQLPQGRVSVSASLGVAFFDGGDRSGEQLLREADQALYEAKALGRNRYAVFAAESAESVESVAV